jgi:hypothetical protein
MVSDKEPRISPDQLCIGMYVHLDLPWTSHPFTFSSFKIKTLYQVAAIQALGIQALRFSPERSDSQPLPASEAPAEASASAAPPDNAALQVKRERLERMAARQAQVHACE